AVRLLFINGRAAALQGWVAVHKRHPPFLAVRAPWVKHRSSDETSVRGPNHVITDWPISDHL
ncbi:unnamed protein product, partial [Staurois parvus]